jgi:FkbM family methyltransferase
MLVRLNRTLLAVGVETVLDVGANQGQYAALLRSAGFRGTIHSFEPLDDAYSLLAKRAKNDSAWFTHHFALGDRPSHANIHVSANSYSSSILPMTAAHLDAAPDSIVEREQAICIEPLASIADRLELQPERTLLKVDTQGFEAKVLAGAGQLLDEIAAVQLELSMVTLYEGQLLFDDLLDMMRQRRFELVSLEPGIANTWGRMLQCDGVFLRRSLLPS